MGFLNAAKLLSEEEQKASEEKRDAESVYWFTTVLSMPFLGFGVFRILTASGIDRAIGIIEIGILFALALNAMLYRRHRRGEITKPIISVIAAVLVIILMFSGGTQGTGIFWFFVLQSTNFPFLGYRTGKIFSVIYLGIFILMGIGEKFDIIHTYYTPENYIQGTIVLAVFGLASFASGKAQHDYQATITSQQKRMRVLLEGLPAGVILFSAPEGRPTLTNGAMEKILGQAVRDDLSIEDFIMVYRLTWENGEPIPMDQLSLDKAMREGANATTPDVFVHRKDGSETVIRIHAAPIKNNEGETVSVIGVFEDMAAEHDTEKAKNELVSLASRQLRTPMEEIRQKIEILLSGETGELNREQLDMLTPITAIIHRLTNFIHDLLSVSDIESGKRFGINATTEDITPIIESINGELKIVADQKQITLANELPENLMMNIDTDKIRELFTNLIGNAIKYSKEGGRVTISMHEDPVIGRVIRVKDDGIGIPVQEQKQIFRRFFRASNVNERVEGTGLGLYIAKEIVDGHGGRIWFDSKEGEGTTFFVALEAERKSAQA